MRTWYIIKFDGSPIIVEGAPYWILDSAIGPFWSYKEAMEVLHVWTK